MTDWIDGFLTYTEKLPSPEIFRLWSGISAIAGALERRVWIVTAGGTLYPNLYTLLVAPPAVGKSQAIMQARSFWATTKGKLYIAPNSTTKASLLDNLAKATRKIPIKNGMELFEYNTLNVASSEFGVLVPSHDTEFLSVLIDIYDNPPDFREDRRTSKSVAITNPQLNILAGTQPGYLATLLPEEAWSMGFMSRVTMIYAGSGPQIELFDIVATKSELQQELAGTMVKLTSLLGEARFSDEAKTEVVRWYKSGMEPVPQHSKLVYYNGRRLLTFLKLCIIATVSRTSELLIELEDITRAKDWLLGAEVVMPDVFREMVQKSDSNVIQELHFYIHKLWVTNNKLPVHESRLIHFLQNRVPSDKVLRVLEIAEKSGIIQRQAGTQLYVPRPKNEWGIE